MTRKAFLEKLSDVGYGKEEMSTLQSLINDEHSDLFDVLGYVSYAVQPISRERVAQARSSIF